MITRDMIERAYNDGIVRITDEYGVACTIGDYWFYFGGAEADEYETAQEYVAAHTVDEIIDYIFDVIEFFRIGDYNIDEYLYYEYFLNEHGYMED